MMTPRRIIIHHSLTKDTSTVSWSAIRQYHTEKLGWSDIGYHAGCELVKNDFECFYGRPATKAGAHTKGANHDSLGFCFVGNFDFREPSLNQLYVAAKSVIVPWMKQFGIPVGLVFPHNSFADNKTCPGKMFDMDKFKDILRSIANT